MECIFCKIAAKTLPADIVFENDRIMAFRDISPVAAHHVLVIPKEHIPRIDDTGAVAYATDVFAAVAKITGQLGLCDAGYRVVCNTGSAGGQTVDHLHFHILGGRNMQWPPG